MKMNEQSKNMTEEEKRIFDDKKKVAAKAYAKRKEDARKIVTDYFSTPESSKIPENVKGSILYLIGKGVRSERSGVSSELKELLLKGPVSLMTIFEKFEIGKPTMEQRIRGFINVKNPADRIWVEFKDGMYTVVGKGENPPKGYEGYLPKVKVEAETL